MIASSMAATEANLQAADKTKERRK